MRTRRVSFLVGLVCLIASTSVAAAPPAPKPLEGVIAGVEVCPQEWEQLCPDGATFFGTLHGKVNGERGSGVFKVEVMHQSPLSLTGETPVLGGSFVVRTTRGEVGGTITGGTLATDDGGETFKVLLTLLVTQPPSTTPLTFKGLLDHSGLKEEIPEPPTITGRIS